MKLFWITIPASLALAGGGMLLIMRSRMAFSNAPAAPNVDAAPRHPVTADMIAKSEALSRKPAPEFTLKDLYGKEWTRTEAQRAKPTLIYFIMDGCPCSTDAEPMFQALWKHHAGDITFVGVINKAGADAKKWHDNHDMPYLMLLSPDHKAMDAFGARESTYSTLVDPDGRIIKQWPGWSKRILTEMNAEMAKATGKSVRPFDTAYAPVADSSGCVFGTKPGTY